MLNRVISIRYPANKPGLILKNEVFIQTIRLKILGLNRN